MSNNNTLGHIRSYVIRTTRMSPAQKRGWEQYGDDYVVPYRENDILDLDSIFDEPRPVILDIGFGMGRELARLAQDRPDFNYIGIEVHKPGVGRLLLDLGETGISNVRIIPHDAVEVCKSMIPPGGIAGVHLFFPDPWPKARHHKRRLVREGFPEFIAPVLKPGGYLYMVTDWEDYAHQILDVMNSSEQFVNEFNGFAPEQSWRPQTAFERKGLAKGHQIFEVMYRRYSKSDES